MNVFTIARDLEKFPNKAPDKAITHVFGTEKSSRIFTTSSDLVVSDFFRSTQVSNDVIFSNQNIDHRVPAHHPEEVMILLGRSVPFS